MCWGGRLGNSRFKTRAQHQFPGSPAPKKLGLGPFPPCVSWLERLRRPEESPRESSEPPPAPQQLPGLDGGGRTWLGWEGLDLQWPTCLSVHLIDSSPVSLPHRGLRARPLLSESSVSPVLQNGESSGALPRHIRSCTGGSPGGAGRRAEGALSTLSRAAGPHLRFWYQVLTCVSVRLREAASSMRSCTLRYFCRSKLRSSCAS